jgi:isoleucyl-tRNA synthetase
MTGAEKNYRDTLNLPQTSFAMKANLVQREPAQQALWARQDIYGKIRQARKGGPLYILHDGPPYANGDIHMGHVINKVLKDIVVRYKTMKGFDAPYVPGWDCHGLPIEVKVMGKLGEQARQMSKLEIRRRCREYASKYADIQSRQFQQLGVFGDFQNPYLTMQPEYEAGILEVFARLVEAGLVYKQLRPVHWSVGCETALAEAELEYQDVSSASIYVNLPLTADGVGLLAKLGLIEQAAAEEVKVCLMIWTTTPWTLAANLAVAVHPKLRYTVVGYQRNGQKFISVVAADRLEAVIAAGRLGEQKYAVGQRTVEGSQLEGLRYLHPFVSQNPTDKDAYMVILADYVTTEDGTGLVHIAPGHGVEDYVSSQRYGLAVYSPVMDDGRYDQTVPEWLRGRSVLEVDPLVTGHLRQINLLFAEGKLVHSYPHCWRSKMPVIFRATEQWFLSVDRPLPRAGMSLRNLALERIGSVRWVPAWGCKRIMGMLESRPDWCISRQRSWGLPIPAFYNSAGQTLLTPQSVLAVAQHIRRNGSDSWFTDSPRQILGEDFVLPAGFSFEELRREENIFDVWFESGCSWYSVAKKAGWPVPVDLYLEGSDQHRGWFQLSLLPALGAEGHEPFKTVLTHGFTVDEKGMKQSKSLGNYINAQEELARYGADILRLWVASVNYQEDMRCSDVLISRLQEAYRKIRNTLRYLLGNVSGFDPATMAVQYQDMLPIDRWAMGQLGELIEETTEAYESFAFHRVFSLIYNFCVVEMSSLYMDVLKDRMYCDPLESLSGRSGRTAMYRILDALVRLLAPVLVHTAEEAWGAMEHKSQAADSVHLALMPQPDGSVDFAAEQQKWQKLMELREDVLRVLEGLRQQQQIGSNQEAEVTVYTEDEALLKLLEGLGREQFAALCIVSEVKVESGGGQRRVMARKSRHLKCRRCWNYWPSVGRDISYSDLCERCAKVVAGTGAK